MNKSVDIVSNISYSPDKHKEVEALIRRFAKDLEHFNSISHTHSTVVTFHTPTVRSDEYKIGDLEEKHYVHERTAE